MNLEYTYESEHDGTWIDCKLRIDYSPGCAATFYDPGYSDYYHVDNIDIVRCNVLHIPFVSQYKALENLSTVDINIIKSALYKLLEEDKNGTLDNLVYETLEAHAQLKKEYNINHA